ncbi:hypothetical protein BpHYR1_018183 [Brachionus plicatilis]|uniref:Chitin-binding type-2 domain-containing protein n=1 Tax=Brachionus plicatilis TaxID=10195 RepID=A0A3M7R4S6_BRAPC|nr:hypothetical protein BpHYR1_018183 [Brachionus plicatilis]
MKNLKLFQLLDNLFQWKNKIILTKMNLMSLTFVIFLAFGYTKPQFLEYLKPQLEKINLIDIYFFNQNDAILQQLTKIERNISPKLTPKLSPNASCSSIDLTCSPGNCSQFRRCIADQVVILKCPNNLLFSNHTKSCQFRL